MRVLTLTFFLASVFGCHSQVDHDEKTQCEQHYRAESYQVALKICKKAAQKGHLNSQWILANLYLKGLHGSKDQAMAVYWFEKAADNGHAASQRELGRSYLWGRGIEKNAELALKWLKLAARDHDSEAQFLIGIIYLGSNVSPSDHASALHWFKKAGKGGHRLAINNIAWIYATSPNKSIRNGEQAVKLMHTLLKKEPDSFVLLDTLGAAQAEASDFKAAIATQQRVLELLPKSIDEKDAIGFHQRLRSYQNGQSWREDKPEWGNIVGSDDKEMKSDSNSSSDKESQAENLSQLKDDKKSEQDPQSDR